MQNNFKRWVSIEVYSASDVPPDARDLQQAFVLVMI
jgi:hypothetical protein